MPERIEIGVTARIEPDGKVHAIVRKAIWYGNRLEIYGLSKSGEWIFRPEGECYPEECLLPVATFRRANGVLARMGVEWENANA